LEPNEAETRLASRKRQITAESEIEGDERPIFRIGPTMLFVKAGYVLTAIAALLLVGLVASLTTVSALAAMVVGFLLFVVPAYYHLRNKIVRYTLTETMLDVDQGFVSRTTRSIPLRRIQDVTVSSTVLQRLFKFGDLVIENASEDSGKIVLKNIGDPRHHADLILRQMRRLED
jgi:uncharacterized membrane protein YdbT with pleckstrin-like domain